MAKMPDRIYDETAAKVVKEAWSSKTNYSRIQSENPSRAELSGYRLRRRSSSMHFPGASEERENSRNQSGITLVVSCHDDNASYSVSQKFVNPGPLNDVSKFQNQDTPKLRKISSASDFIGNSFPDHSSLQPQSAENDRPAHHDQEHRKHGKITRRGSLPGNYFENYLSVNSIRKRAHSLRSVNDSDDLHKNFTTSDESHGTRKARRPLRDRQKYSHSPCEESDTEALHDSKESNEWQRSSENIVAEESASFLSPIERFRKIVQLLSFLLKMKTSMDRKHRSQQTSVVFADLDEETMAGVDCDGVVFDPRNFKAVREVQLSQEAIHILSLSPGSRSPEQLQTALVALKTSVAAFGEYPLKMQKRLVTVGWYERFEAKRVIIRQGHRAENFYFILSGSALVTLLLNDPSTGEQRNTTVAVLGKGSSFGELALLHHKTRSATVLCKDEVSLLAVCREDFRDIFMGYEDGKELEHIRFLKSVPFLKELPVHDLTTKHDVCIFHYFRRGVVIVNESKTDWIYIVKTGSCRVLTHLTKKTAKLKRSGPNLSRSRDFLPVIPIDEVERRRALYTAAGQRTRPTVWSPDGKRPRTEPALAPTKRTDLSLPALVGESERFKKTAKNVTWIARMSMIPQEVKAREAHRQTLEKLHKTVSNLDTVKNKLCSASENEWSRSNTLESDSKGEQVVVQIEVLKPKDQFGLSVLLFDNPAVKCHLVSNGAECVLIKKSWFLQHVNEATLRKLRNQIPPYPSQATLEQKMQDQANWDSYKTQTINNLLDTLQI